MKYIACEAGILRANCYIVYDELALEGVIIDPGGDAHVILKKCKQNNIDIKYIILTHGHGDHIGGAADIKDATNAKIFMNRKDEYLVKGGTQKLIPIFRRIREFAIDEYVTDGQIIELKGLKIEVLETPGHTPGGICLKINNSVFSGDTLFRTSIGRTDFEYGSTDELLTSIHGKLLTLTEETNILPGHGEATTIGYEKKYNPFL